MKSDPNPLDVEMENFVSRSITAKDGDMQVSRTRTSAGFSSIVAVVGNTRITFDTPNDGDDYEQRALRFSRLIDQVASDRCELPEMQKP